jgi:hypothetical protein
VGLQDRDYMRDRNRKTFERATRPSPRHFAPSKSGSSLLFKVGCWVCLAFILYKGFSWIENRRKRVPPVQQAQYAYREAAPERAVRAPAPTPQPTYSPPAQYTAPPVARAAPAQETSATEAPRARTSGTIYLCRDYSGGTFWSSAHCNQSNGLIEQIVSVPEGMPFQQQVQIAQERRRALASAETVYTSSAPAAMPAPASRNKFLCESLDARVVQLDAMARQPQSGTTQDWIRSERQKTRDEQFRLRC